MLDKDWRRHYAAGGHPPACTCVACTEGSSHSRSTATATYGGNGGGTRRRSNATSAYRNGNGGGCAKIILWGLLIVGAIITFSAFSGCTIDDIRRFLAPPEPTPPPIVVVITATPADTPTSTSTPISTLTPTSTSAPVLAVAPTNTATHTPAPTATLRPTFTPTATKTPLPTATGTSTSTPTTTPTITPTAFVCGYAEMVLMGAGKKHRHCHTPTPEGYIAPRHTNTPVSVSTATPIPAHTYTPVPTSTPTVQPFTVVVIPVPTNTPTAATTPIPTNTPRVIVVPISSNSPTATATDISTPVYTPTPETNGVAGSSPHLRHIEEKRYMLTLINAERVKASVPPVELGDNIAAQLHAESALQNCFASHWGIDGLKPYMRYSLAGGYQSNGENGHGLDYCIKSSDRYTAIHNTKHEIDDAMDGWMESPGHRRNILDKQHKKVNIGLAWDSYNFLAYQHFEGEYVEYDELPNITGRDTLSFSGTTLNGVSFRSKRDLGVQVYYDPPPRDLTRGQVSRTYCYDGGRQVASLREPLTGNRYWPEDKFTKMYNPCPDPYDVPANSPPARSHNEAHRLWQEAYNTSKNQKEQTLIVPWITASEWTASRNAFSVTVNINEVLEEHGDGVYTIVVWADVDGERAVISEYSIFHGITPPDTYTPR